MHLQFPSGVSLEFQDAVLLNSAKSRPSQRLLFCSLQTTSPPPQSFQRLLCFARFGQLHWNRFGCDKTVSLIGIVFIAREAAGAASPSGLCVAKSESVEGQGKVVSRYGKNARPLARTPIRSKYGVLLIGKVQACVGVAFV